MEKQMIQEDKEGRRTEEQTNAQIALPLHLLGNVYGNIW